MCEKISVYAGEKRDQVNILRLCCGCGVCGVFASLPAVVVGSVGSLLQCCLGSTYTPLLRVDSGFSLIPGS